MDVIDIRTFQTIENERYDSRNLISPTLSYTISGAVAYQDSIRDVQHSVRTYKGKIFLLVREFIFAEGTFSYILLGI